MEYRRFGGKYVVRLDRGDRIVACMTEFCKKEGIESAEITGLGAIDYVKMGLYDIASRQYISRELEGPMEVTSLVGSVTRKDGEVYLHLHINVADVSLTVKGGHLNEARVAVTAEIAVSLIDGAIGRSTNETTGMVLMDFGK